jgi:hypothetical protein
MSTFVYRFRPVEALLERFHELEKQEIYFAPPAELNDPYDGAIEVQWSGDEILWRNLLNHYLLCLVHALARASITPDDSELLNRGLILGSDGEIAHEAIKQLYQRTKARFYALADAPRLPRLLADRTQPIGRNELRMYLRVLHGHTAQMVISVMKELGFVSAGSGANVPFPFDDAASRCCQIIEIIGAEEKAGTERRHLGDVFGDVFESYHSQQNLAQLLDGATSFANRRGLFSVLTDFPARYVTELETLLYSQWFTACFVEDATNAAMWGIYGNAHKGVALKFRTHEVNGQPALVLNRITGFAGGKDRPMHPVRGDHPHVLEQVRYPQRFECIEFFQMMGRITGEGARFWHFDEAGTQSPRSRAEGFHTDEWRMKYWKTLKAALTTKHEDWKHERERRIILYDGLVDFQSAKENRKLVYRFEDLEGIVFGGRTPAVQIVEIVRAVRAKCRKAGRKQFEFLQAEYSPPEGKMVLVPLTMLKVE